MALADDILDSLRNIAAFGWTKGRLFGGDDLSRCSVGAVMSSVQDGLNDGDQRELAVVSALNKELGFLGLPHRTIIAFNDDPKSTIQDVSYVFLSAAKRAGANILIPEAKRLLSA